MNTYHIIVKPILFLKRKTEMDLINYKTTICAKSKEDAYKKLANTRWEDLNNLYPRLKAVYLRLFNNKTKEEYLKFTIRLVKLFIFEGFNSKLEYILVNSNLTKHNLFDSCMILSTISNF